MSMLASAFGNIALGVIIVIVLAGLVWAYTTRRGSGIDQHPQGDSLSEAPGVGSGSSRVAGTDEGEQERFDEHGTR